MKSTLHRLGAVIGLITISLPVNAATVCQGIGIIGFSEPQQRAKRVLTNSTKIANSLEIYVEKFGPGYYYESNFLHGAAAFTTKIFSQTPLTFRAIVENVLFRSRAEADRHASLVNEVISTHLIVHADAALLGVRSPILDAQSVSRIRVIVP